MKNLNCTKFWLLLAALLISLVSSSATASAAPAGKLVAWGWSEFGQTNVPSGDNFVAITAGEFHALALRSDGSLAGWGSNKGDKDLRAGDIFYGQATVPVGHDFKAIAAGAFHSLALRTSGSLVGWGSNEIFGDDANPTGQATVPAGNDFVAIAAAAGGFHSLALKSDGSLVAWGDNSEGQTNVPPGNDFVAIAAGDFHNVALKADGSLVVWGQNNVGQISSAPAGNGFRVIAAGWGQTLVLKSDGSMLGWGWNVNGQAAPRPGTDFVAVAAGWRHSLALKSDGSMVGWGWNYGLDATAGIFYGQAIPRAGTNFIAIAAGDRFSVAIQSQPQSVAPSGYEPYTFTTLAGGGGFNRPSTPGSAARFLYPITVAVDSAGNLYVAELGNHSISKVTPAGAVTTLAGRPGSFGSANGPGSAARFNLPSSAVVDNAGNIYVADTANCTIRKVSPAGEVTTLAGLAGSPGSANGTGSAARFNFPFGLVADSAGNIYVADSDNHTIRKVTPVGTNWVVTTIAGLAGNFGSADGTGSGARFNFPQGVVVDSAGALFVSDVNNHTIRKMTLVGANWVVTTVAGLAGNRGSVDGTNRNARFSEPGGLAFDSGGNLYVADWASSTIRKMTPAGTNWVVTTAAGLAGSFGSVNGTNSDARFNIPGGVAVDSADNVYVADVANNLIRKMALTGTNWVVTTVAGLGGNYGGVDGPGNVARFKGPSGVAVDLAGNTYVADTLNHTIRKVTPAGEVTTIAGLAGYGGSTNGMNSTARFNDPSGVAVDNAGNVYVADTVNHTIRKITKIGSNWFVTTIAGLPNPSGNGGCADGTGSAARFSFPVGLAIDSAGNLYVADYNNHTIRKVTPGGVVTTPAGSCGEVGSTDGTGATARFNNPFGVAVDSATNIYVADTSNHTIRKITPARVVTTLAGQAGSPGSADGIGTTARFDFPSSIAVDLAGNLYVADAYNNTIRKLTRVGTNWVVTTLGGMTGFYGTADGVGSAVRFSNPAGLAVDADGNVYVADYYFNTIRKGFPAPRIFSAGFSLGQFSFDLPGPTGHLVVIEGSTDLVNWLPIGTNTFGGLLNFSDPQSGIFSNRFYRAYLP